MIDVVRVFVIVYVVYLFMILYIIYVFFSWFRIMKIFVMELLCYGYMWRLRGMWECGNLIVWILDGRC